MFTVRIYAEDPGSKSGRKKINKNTNGGSTVETATDLVNKSIAGLAPENRAKIVRILIESPNAPAAGDGDLKLSFDAPAANGAATTPAPATPAPAAQPAAKSRR